MFVKISLNYTAFKIIFTCSADCKFIINTGRNLLSYPLMYIDPSVFIDLNHY